jgi:hypothetical protein
MHVKSKVTRGACVRRSIRRGRRTTLWGDGDVDELACPRARNWHGLPPIRENFRRCFHNTADKVRTSRQRARLWERCTFKAENRGGDHHTKTDEVEKVWITSITGCRTRKLISAEVRAAALHMLSGKSFILSTVIRLVGIFPV